MPGQAAPPEPLRGASAALSWHREEETSAVTAAACANKRPRGGNAASRAGENPNLLVQSPRLEERIKSQIRLGFSHPSAAPKLVLSGEAVPAGSRGSTTPPRWCGVWGVGENLTDTLHKRLKLNVKLISCFISKQLRVIMSVTV